ncbi:MAG: homoserine dehydrogenase [Oscillospiraceae bacterium]
MNIGIMGFGNVGRGAYNVISDKKTGLCVKRILDIGALPGYESLLTTKPADIFEDGEIDAVVESIGGIEPARSYVLAALRAKKHVVTANKQLISACGEELEAAAQENKVELRYSASVGGGIPWLFSLSRAARTDEIIEVGGIVNGTTNFILDAMTKQGADFDDTLKEAQRLGFAESDPSADIDALDSHRKCVISARCAFNAAVTEQDIPFFGIRDIKGFDIERFKSLKRVCKLFIFAKKQGGAVSAFAEPTLFADTAVEGAIPSNYNFIYLVGARSGKLGFFGQGAGSDPTGATVVADLADIAFRHDGANTRHPEAFQIANDTACHSYYVRTSNASAADEFYAESDDKSEIDGNYVCITKPLPVSYMHQKAKKMKELDPHLFFAGLYEDKV